MNRRRHRIAASHRATSTHPIDPKTRSRTKNDIISSFCVKRCRIYLVKFSLTKFTHNILNRLYTMMNGRAVRSVLIRNNRTENGSAEHVPRSIQFDESSEDYRCLCNCFHVKTGASLIGARV
ncbi:hypothetical protein DICVIV_10338 [Dictyocaulus viviparus]|uniref:Uncharacterized protein n=1 Tax=Dictyocaulus viviparus TaxID=29172 RepID=A0A0D8XIP7_DICVI|nr:hypothetical protein DICVIV_10338 [Dictyocaulus viviparus]